MKIIPCLWILLLCGHSAAFGLAIEDAYIRAEERQWTLGTASVERVIGLENGKLLLKSLKNKLTGQEFVPESDWPAEFSVRIDDAPVPITSSTGTWKLVRADQMKLKQGELQLELVLQQEPLQVTRTYVVYPGSSIISQWTTFSNVGNRSFTISEPSFLNETLRPGDPNQLDFHWMTGGDNVPGSWMLKTEKLTAGKLRAFDSFEPFAATAGIAYPGDGINAKVLLNGKQVWPEKDWQFVPNAVGSVPVDFSADVVAGDKLEFLVNMNGNIGYDTTAFDPVIEYGDGETHAASKEFSDTQGQHGWRYQYIEDGKHVDLVYYPQPRQWRKEKDNSTGTPFVGADNQHPDANQDAVRVWIAPKNGRVRVTALVCNTGNRANGYRYHMGSGTYAPWYALLAKDTRNGVVIGWDYFGHWKSSVQMNAQGGVNVQLNVVGHKQTLPRGESIRMPRAFVGLFRDELDNAGNEVLDWQYRYLWDYTRDGWFPAIRVLGYWMKGTSIGQPGVGWPGGKPDFQSTYRKVFRVADLMRYIGGDVYHRDWGWWDMAGEWNGPDFRSTGDYLRKSGMRQLIYAFLYTVDRQSQVVKDHPDWALEEPYDWVGGKTLDMSRPEVVEFIKRQLDDFHSRWGDFEWRNDSYPTYPRNGDDSLMLGQDAGLRKIIRDFLDKYPGSAFQAVNGGGCNAGYDYARYASTLSFSDGAVGIVRNYYAALLLPPDKTSDIPDLWDPDKYDKAIWRGLLCINFDMTGDTWDPVKLEGLRELIDIYHYLHQQEVVGRWVRVYRPVILGDPDPTMYFERLSGDRKRGIIIPKRPAPGSVTIKPKGLLPDETYTVSFHESEALSKRTGRDLMGNGVTIEKMPAGELIYLNLPLHPGSKLDKQPPASPGNGVKQWARNMGYPGVEVTWSPATDDNWLSYYVIWRNGKPIDKVAKGTYYFDHSAGADVAAAYEISTVDGAGNASPKAVVHGPASKPVRVLDDAATGELVYTGSWNRETNLQPAYEGTISSATAKGHAVEFAVEGRCFRWFSKLGADCGRAFIRIDNGEPTVIDTYSADDIWGVCVFAKRLPTAGKHTIRIEVLGEKNPKSDGTKVYLDGVQAF